jgi:uncharacterized protein YciI
VLCPKNMVLVVIKSQKRLASSRFIGQHHTDFLSVQKSEKHYLLSGSMSDKYGLVRFKS